MSDLFDMRFGMNPIVMHNPPVMDVTNLWFVYVFRKNGNAQLAAIATNARVRDHFVGQFKRQTQTRTVRAYGCSMTEGLWLGAWAEGPN